MKYTITRVAVLAELLSMMVLPSVTSFSGAKKNFSSDLRRQQQHERRKGLQTTTTILSATSRSNNERDITTSAYANAMMQTLFTGRSNSGGSSSSLVQLDLVGVGYMPITYSNDNDDDGDDNNSKNNKPAQPSNTSKDKQEQEKIQCLFLAPAQRYDPKAKFYAMPIPIASPSRKKLLPLLEAAYRNEAMSKVRCQALNSILVNRDNGLYDNLPWNEWGLGYEKDAAGLPVDEKYRLGKRDAFDRFNGKDWPGRSFSIGNLAARAMYELRLDDDTTPLPNDATFDDDATRQLAKRVLELELKEAAAVLAEAEEEFAISRMEVENGGYDISSNQKLDDMYEAVADRRENLGKVQAAVDDFKSPATASSFMKKFLQGVIDMTTGENDQDEDGKSKKAPYRGAYGYSPYIDSRSDMFDKIYPYNGPFDLLYEIITEQLQADVLGVAIEDSWLLDGLVLGGACVLERTVSSRKETIQIGGESVEISTSNDDENDIAQSGDLKIVECDVEEALGVALASGLGISVERNIWESTRIRAEYRVKQGNEDSPVEEDEVFPVILSVDKESSIRRSVESSQSEEENRRISSPFSGIKSTSGLFSDPSESSGGSSTNEDSNSVKSVEVFDSMSIKEKAALLLSLESFKGRLPRPRVIREAGNTAKPLDDLLLPLIDEGVRRQLKIREAVKNGDTEVASELQQRRSKRQQARELAEAARRDGNDSLADMWNDEAELLSELKADTTQDEESYSTYLDKDEWYERDRASRAKKIKKSSFGNLFDGL